MSGNMAFFFDLVARPGGSTWWPSTWWPSTWWLDLVALYLVALYLVHLAPLCTTNYPPLLAIVK